MISVRISLFCEHLVQARLLDVQDLAAQRQDRLEAAVAALLGRAAGRVALDDVELGSRRVALASSRPACRAGVNAVERALALHQFAGLAGGLAGAGGGQALLDDSLARPDGFSSRKPPSASLTTVWTAPATSALPSLPLVWPSNCGSGSLTVTIAVRPSRTSSPERLSHRSLRKPFLRGVVVERAGERRAEAGEVRAAVDRC